MQFLTGCSQCWSVHRNDRAQLKKVYLDPKHSKPNRKGCKGLFYCKGWSAKDAQSEDRARTRSTQQERERVKSSPALSFLGPSNNVLSWKQLTVESRWWKSGGRGNHCQVILSLDGRTITINGPVLNDNKEMDLKAAKAMCMTTVTPIFVVDANEATRQGHLCLAGETETTPIATYTTNIYIGN